MISLISVVHSQGVSDIVKKLAPLIAEVQRRQQVKGLEAALFVKRLVITKVVTRRQRGLWGVDRCIALGIYSIHYLREKRFSCPVPSLSASLGSIAMRGGY